MENSIKSNSPRVKIFGYCEKNSTEIEQFIKENHPKHLIDLSGQFIVIIEENKNTFIVSSAYGLSQYFYYYKDNKFFHADTVLNVLQQGNISWQWNWSALADLTCLDFVLENETLHPDVHRIEPASVYQFDGTKLSKSSKSWEELHSNVSSTAEDALIEFNNEVKKWLKPDSIVSMSGGFDSRTILSSVLKNDVKPLLLTMGFDDSIDVIISKEIAKQYGLDILQITLSIEDYLNHGLTISNITNGTALFNNWHTFIYTHKPEFDKNRTFFVGANGEFARSFFHDQGILTNIANLAPSFSIHQIWNIKLKKKRLFDSADIERISPQYSNFFSEENTNLRIKRLCKLSHNRILMGLDRFYLEQRVKNAISDGMKMHQVSLSWITPFLGQKWVNAIWNMKQNMKFGSNWHRYAIYRNCPSLLNIQEEKTARPMKPKAEYLYWSSFRKKLNRRLYSDYPLWFTSNIVEEFIMDNGKIIEEIIDYSVINKIVKEHKIMRNRTSMLSFIITLIFWKQNIDRIKKTT